LLVFIVAVLLCDVCRGTALRHVSVEYKNYLLT